LHFQGALNIFGNVCFRYLPFLATFSPVVAMGGEDWNRPECEIPGIIGKFLDAAETGIQDIVPIPCRM